VKLAQSIGAAVWTKSSRSNGNGARTPAYLAANGPRNRQLYQRLGYTDLGDPVTAHHGPPIFPMWWTPQPDSPHSRNDCPRTDTSCRQPRTTAAPNRMGAPHGCRGRTSPSPATRRQIHHP
jgi:hypothetical protein